MRILFAPGYFVVAVLAVIVTILIVIYTFFTPSSPMFNASQYDHTDTIDAAGTQYIAAITNARLDTPGQPPTSTLTIFDGTTNETLGEWTLGTKEFWTADPDGNVIADGSWGVDARCYTHDVWSGNYSPGAPLTEKSSRDFCF